MAIAMFKSFWPVVRRWVPGHWNPGYKIIQDSQTGAPVGILSQNANGPDGIWAPVPLSSSEIASPAAVILADLNATYQLNEAPYTRFRSTGTELVPLGSEAGSDGTTYPGAVMQTVGPSETSELDIGADSYLVVYSPWTIQNAAGVSVEGRVDVIDRPA